MNLSTEKKQTHGLGEQTCGCQGEGGGRAFQVVLGSVFEVSFRASAVFFVLSG